MKHCSMLKSLGLNMQPEKKIDKAALKIFKNFSFAGIQLTHIATFSLFTYCQWCIVKDSCFKRDYWTSGNIFNLSRPCGRFHVTRKYL